tara:strand:- start:66 stop:284 length:219 start_codon:yes stop_codon:yes gene_type:complete
VVAVDLFYVLKDRVLLVDLAEVEQHLMEVVDQELQVKVIQEEVLLLQEIGQDQVAVEQVQLDKIELLDQQLF